MTVAQLLRLAEARMVHLSALRAEAERLGDAVEMERVESELASTQATITALHQLT